MDEAKLRERRRKRWHERRAREREWEAKQAKEEEDDDGSDCLGWIILILFFIAIL